MHRRVLTLLVTMLALGFSALTLCESAFAQEHAQHAAAAKAKSASLMTGYGDWHHPVSTKNTQAQAFFDQGLRLIYAFNHDEAMRSFQRAAELDPKLAMAYWGVAEAMGPNYNDPASEGRFAQAHAAIEKALTLGADASESDQAYIAAIHYYIHSVEASSSPERALAGANRLAQLAPAAGHVVHMPAHIYIRTGDYEAAVKTNQKAALADQAYIQGGAAPGIYSMMYYSHNLHFIAMAAAMNGNYPESRRGAQLLAANVGPHVKDMPPLEGFMTVPLAVEVRFHKWNEILKAPQPNRAMHTATVFWHFARGLAFAGTGKLDEAEAEHKLVAEAEEKTPLDAIFQMPINNKTKDILKIAENVLGAKISLAKNDMDATVNQLRAAVAVQDSLKYDEPQDWFYPVRESLGAVLLKIGDDAGAEETFRADLDRNPRNPRSLFGLEQALKAMDRNYDAGFIRKQFDANWKGAARPT